jgi:hypothetical protein
VAPLHPYHLDHFQNLLLSHHLLLEMRWKQQQPPPPQQQQQQQLKLPKHQLLLPRLKRQLKLLLPERPN